MARSAALIGLYVAVVILPLWLVTRLSTEAEGVVYDVGRNLGLTGFMILILQLVLAARIKWIELASMRILWTGAFFLGLPGSFSTTASSSTRSRIGPGAL
ncbi:MAG: hypothetical protein V5A74_10365 [Desulfohalobiaceae bacterium]